MRKGCDGAGRSQETCRRGQPTFTLSPRPAIILQFTLQPQADVCGVDDTRTALDGFQRAVAHHIHDLPSGDFVVVGKVFEMNAGLEF